MLWIAVAAIWIVCGVLAYGLAFAHYQGEFALSAEKRVSTDQAFAWIMATLGPVGLLTELCSGGTAHGLKFRSSERTDKCV